MNNYLTNTDSTLFEKTPQEIFDKLKEGQKDFSIIIRFFGIIGWSNILNEINLYKQQVSFYPAGLALCKFAIAVIEGDTNYRIAHDTLDLGTECLKSLYEILCQQNPNWQEKEKSYIIQWGKTFLDIWKQYMEKVFEDDRRFIN